MSVAVQTTSPYDLTRILAHAQLPALPQSAIKILDLSKDADNGPAEYAKPIESDPGLASQVLRFVNSSYFGFSREISSVKLAITLVGVRTIKNFTLWSAVFSLMPNPKSGSLDLKCLWQDSLRRALLARTLSKLLGLKEGEEAFAAALLQDMAIPVLAKELHAEYDELFKARQQGQRLGQLERDKFGFDHAQAAAQMGQKWNLPGELTQAIAQHTNVERLTADSGVAPGALAVALSALLPATVDAVWTERPQFEDYYRRTAGPNWPAVAELLGEVDKNYAEFAPLLKMPSTGKSLVERLAEG